MPLIAVKCKCCLASLCTKLLFSLIPSSQLFSTTPSRHHSSHMLLQAPTTGPSSQQRSCFSCSHPVVLATLLLGATSSS